MSHGCTPRARPELAKLGQRPMRQTWNSPIRKADAPVVPEEPPPSAWKWILDIAATLEPSVRKAFMRAMKQSRDKINEAALREALAGGNVEDALQALRIEEAVPEALSANLAPALDEVFTAAGTETLPRTFGASVAMRFDIRNPKAAEFIRDYDFNLIRQISDDTREGIRRVIANAFANGGHPYVQARTIRDSIGLTDSQAAAVNSYRGLLETSDRAALTRALRDRRFDPSVRAALGAEDRSRALTPEQIDKMVGRYRDRFIDLRAQTIARTECLTGDTLVDSAVVRAVFRRPYEGDVIKIVAEGGRDFTATPNHPMLTTRGWVSAGDLTNADYLICDDREQNARSSGDQNVNSRPTSIAEIFDTLSAIGVAERRVTGKPDFHGDGRDGYVDVFCPDGELEIGCFAPLFEPTIKDIFAPADMVRAPICSFCRRLLSVDKQKCLCSGAQGDTSPLEAPRDRTPVGSQGFCDSSQRDSSKIATLDIINSDIVTSVGGLSASAVKGTPSISKGAADSGALGSITHEVRGAAHHLRDFSGAQAGSVKIKRVLSVERHSFSGHVFNLSTPYGYFCINGGAYTGNTMRASNAAQNLAWAQAADNGLLDAGTLRRFWLVTPDDRLCPFCAAVPDDNPDGQPLDGVFETDLGPVAYPPLHPNCRCITFIGPQTGDNGAPAEQSADQGVQE